MGSKFVCPVCKYEMGADAADKFKYEEQGNPLDKEIWSGDINDVKVVQSVNRNTPKVFPAILQFPCSCAAFIVEVV